MSDVASLLGLPPEFEFGEKTYKVYPRTLELEGMFGRWVADEALKGVLAHRDGMPTEILQAQLDGWRHDKAARIYDYGGWVCVQALASAEGQKRLALLQLAKLNSGVSRELIEKIHADPAKWQELLLKMQEASGELRPPNAQDPASRAEAG